MDEQARVFLNTPIKEYSILLYTAIDDQTIASGGTAYNKNRKIEFRHEIKLK